MICAVEVKLFENGVDVSKSQARAGLTTAVQTYSAKKAKMLKDVELLDERHERNMQSLELFKALDDIKNQLKQSTATKKLRKRVKKHQARDESSSSDEDEDDMDNVAGGIRVHDEDHRKGRRLQQLDVNTHSACSTLPSSSDSYLSDDASSSSSACFVDDLLSERVAKVTLANSSMHRKGMK